MLGGDAVEPVLDILPGDGIQRTLQPVGEVDPQVLVVEPHRVGRPVGVGRHVALEGLGQRRNAARLGTLAGGVVAPCDPPQQVLGHAPGLVGRDASKASDDDPLIRRLAPAVAGAVVDDEGLGTGGLDADAEAGELAAPDPLVCARNCRHAVPDVET